LLSRRVWKGIGILGFWALVFLNGTGKKTGKMAHRGILKVLVLRRFEGAVKIGKITGNLPV
jgi:hypothetical protein